jgi:hypothetical protein
MAIPFDRLQRMRTHILHHNCRETLCGRKLDHDTLYRTDDGECVVLDVETIINSKYSSHFRLDAILEATSDDMVDPYTCEECLAFEAPSLPRRDGLGATSKISLYREKYELERGTGNG